MSKRQGKRQTGKRQTGGRQLTPTQPTARFDATRAIAVITVVADVFAAICIAIAMAKYPGGTGANPHADGHLFWENVLCDLQQPVAFNGQSNAAAQLAGQLGSLSLFFAGTIANALAPAATGGSVAGRAARRYGVAGGIIGAMLPLTPSTEHPLLHTLVILLAGPLAMLTLTNWVRALRQSPGTPPALRWLTYSLAACTGLAFATWFGWFTRMFIERSADSDTAFPAPLVPVFQRLAVLVWMVWMVWIAARAWRATQATQKS